MSRYSAQVLKDPQEIDREERQISDKLRVFQRAAWLSLVGEDLTVVICRDAQGVMKGYLPLVRTKKFKLRSFHIPPYTPYFGPLIFEDDLVRRMEIAEILLKPVIHESHLDMGLSVDNNDLIPFIRSGFTIEARQTHIFRREKKCDPDTVHPSKRRYLKKLLEALSKGDILLKRDGEAVADLIKLNLITEQRASFRGQASVLQKLLSSSFVEGSVTVLYDKMKNPLAGAFCPRDSISAYHLINASQRNEDSLLDKANILSTYLMVKNANENDLNFDFEGSNVPGVANFYRMMGGEPQINFRMQKSTSLYYNFLRSVQRIRKEKNAI